MLTLRRRLEFEARFGPDRCNTCLHWGVDAAQEPCLSCCCPTSQWKSCREAVEQLERKEG